LTIRQVIARESSIERATNETHIVVSLNLDGSGQAEIDTGIGFYDHMLHHIAVHGLIDMTVKATGDLHVDPHHTVEDVAIAFGQALNQSLGDRAGIVRMGHAYVPMDEALARVVIDLSGRPYTIFEAEFDTQMIGGLPTSLVQHVFESLATHAKMNLHAAVLYGRDDHHKVEALFKAFGRALDTAIQFDKRRRGVASTKGTLTA